MDLSAFGIRTVSHETYPKTPRSSSLVERAPEHPARSEYRKPVPDQDPARIVPTTRTDHFHQGSLF